MEFYVGRQPIFTTDGSIFGYELLYRNSEENMFPQVDGDQATIGVIINAFLSAGLQDIVEEGPCFVNFTSTLLRQDLFDGLDPSRVVIEVLEDVGITPALISRFRQLKKRGFQIALDDFILSPEYQSNASLFGLIDYVKVDYLATSESDRVHIQAFMKRYPHVRLLAEKVETEEQYLEAKKAGYSLFQGYFFAQPQIVTGVDLPPDMVRHFSIIEELNKDIPNVDRISRLIEQDVGLMFKLLRLINSPTIGLARRISSIKQAIVILGLKELKKWLQVLSLSEAIGKNTNGRMQALVELSLVRAKLCELLAKKAGKKNAEDYFLAGMFSLLDVILRRPWSEILGLIPLSTTISNTLSGVATEMTPYIQLTAALERQSLGEVTVLAEEIGIEEEDLRQFSFEAAQWSRLLH